MYKGLWLLYVKFIEYKCIRLDIVEDLEINQTLALSSGSLKSSGEDTTGARTTWFQESMQQAPGQTVTAL